jgi:hypothetical protein
MYDTCLRDALPLQLLFLQAARGVTGAKHFFFSCFCGATLEMPDNVRASVKLHLVSIAPQPRPIPSIALK